MLQKMFTVYDQKAKAYLPPWFMGELGQATRIFSDCCSSKDHQFGVHPEDYELYEVGVFDDNLGTVEPLVVRNHLGNGVMFRQSPITPEEEYEASAVSDDTPILPGSEGGDSS